MQIDVTECSAQHTCVRFEIQGPNMVHYNVAQDRNRVLPTDNSLPNQPATVAIPCQSSVG